MSESYFLADDKSSKEQTTKVANRGINKSKNINNNDIDNNNNNSNSDNSSNAEQSDGNRNEIVKYDYNSPVLYSSALLSSD